MLLISPPPDLRDWVQAGVVMHAGAALQTTRFPALTRSMLVIRIAGDVHLDAGEPAPSLLPAAALILPTTRFTRYLHGDAVHAVGLVMQPSALAGLLQGSAQGLADTRLQVADVLGPGGRTLVQAVQDAVDDQARLALLFDAVRQRVADPRHAARRRRLQLLGESVTGDLAQACRLLGVGPRQLQRLCLDGFGLTPKQFQATARMQRTLRAALHQPAGRGGGADLAAQHGYYDQSHLTRDMRRLAGQPLRGLLGPPAGPGTPDWPLMVGARFS